MCDECFGVPYEKIVADKQHPLRFGMLYAPAMQNVKQWVEQRKAKFLQVDFAEIEKRFLANLEAADPMSAGLLFAWYAHNSQGGRFSGSLCDCQSNPHHPQCGRFLKKNEARENVYNKKQKHAG